MKKNLTNPLKLKETLAAFSLIEALVAILVTALAGMALLTMTTNTLKEAKLNELKGIMNNEAIAGIQMVRNIKDVDWQSVSDLSISSGYVINPDGPNFEENTCGIDGEGYPQGTYCTDNIGPNGMFTRTIDIIENDQANQTIKFKVNVMCRKKSAAQGNENGCDNELLKTVTIIGFISNTGT